MGTVLNAALLPAAALTSTLVLVGVLIASGVAKLRTPDDSAGWEAMGIPAGLRHGWLIRLHPFAELALAAALLLLGGPLGTAAAVVAVLLFAGYLVIVWNARRQSPDASCACFGERRPLTGRTVLRNIWLLALALISAATIGGSPIWGGAALLALLLWPWTLALAVVAVTLVLVREGSEPQPVTAAAPSGAADEELEDYLRARTPAVPVTLADGTTRTLRELTAEAPLLLLAVSETCGSCTP